MNLCSTVKVDLRHYRNYKVIKIHTNEKSIRVKKCKEMKINLDENIENFMKINIKNGRKLRFEKKWKLRKGRTWTTVCEKTKLFTQCGDSGNSKTNVITWCLQ